MCMIKNMFLLASNCTVGSIKSIQVLYFVKETFVSKKFKNERAIFHNSLILMIINVKDILALQHVTKKKKKTQIKHTKHIKIAALTKDTAPVRTYQSLEIKKEGKRNNKNEEAHHSNDVIRELHYGKRKYVFR